MMDILNEKSETMVNMEVDMSNSEIDRLSSYYDEHCPHNIKTNHKISWAVQDILIQQINKVESDNES